MHHYDVVVRGGTVVDGTRLPRFRADVGVKDGRITKIGRIPAGQAAEELDATGLIVAPGFVDLHSHYDAQVHWDPYCSISGWHGVTSLALGNCGFGFAPVRVEDRDRSLLMMTRTEQIPYESMKAGMRWDWVSFPEWLDNLERIPKGVNIVSYVPINALMVYVMGLEAAKSGRPATDAERGKMQRLLREAMLAGASGFSVQRLGFHSMQADYDGTPFPTDIMSDEDMLALADVLAEVDQGLIQITNATGGDIPHEGIAKHKDFVFIEELARRAQRPVIMNAIAVMEGTDLHREAVAWVEDCNRRGLRIVAQGVNVRTWFQFTLEFWNMYDTSPAWNRATQGSLKERLAKLSDPDLVAQMVAEDGQLVTSGLGGSIARVTVVSDGGNPELEQYVGRTLGEIATSEGEGRHYVEVMVDIARRSRLQAEFRTHDATCNDAEKVGELMRSPYVLPGASDGGAHTKFFTGGSYPTDYIAWLVRETGTVSLEEAHWHLSYLPAQTAGFVDRGSLREGAYADIVVYDLDRLIRVPNFESEIAFDFPAGEWRRVQRAEGYRWIIVNGTITFEDGKCTDSTPGELIRAHVDDALAAPAGPS